MAARKPRTILALPPAMALADKLRAGLQGDPDFKPDDLPTETPGIEEPGALFHVTAADGAVYRIRINRR